MRPLLNAIQGTSVLFDKNCLIFNYKFWLIIDLPNNSIFLANYGFITHMYCVMFMNRFINTLKFLMVSWMHLSTYKFFTHQNITLAIFTEFDKFYLMPILWKLEKMTQDQHQKPFHFQSSLRISGKSFQQICISTFVYAYVCVYVSVYICLFLFRYKCICLGSSLPKGGVNKDFN